MKRVVIVHGWDGTPEEGWFPWLKRELEVSGFKVVVPQLPDARWPRIEKWIPALSAEVGAVDEETYFVGHSMGCQAIVRYLETLSQEQKAGGAVFVAGFFKRLTGLGDDPEVQRMDEHWLTTPLDLEIAKIHLPQSIAIFSDDDSWVPLDNQDDFKNKLGSKIIVEHAMKHFSGGTGCVELPIVLESVLKLAQS
jgi:uncharacterized protein